MHLHSPFHGYGERWWCWQEVGCCRAGTAHVNASRRCREGKGAHRAAAACFRGTGIFIFRALCASSEGRKLLDGRQGSDVRKGAAQERAVSGNRLRVVLDLLLRPAKKGGT
jgi:hypothetical protein